eukprot:6660850-Pyramimonas_sp.AAC.1
MRAARSFARKGQDLFNTQEVIVTRNLRRAIIEGRKLHRNVCCSCPECAGRGLGCPRGAHQEARTLRRHRGAGLMALVEVTAPILTQRHTRSS